MSRRSKRLSAAKRDGTSQAARVLPALAPDYVSVDERDHASLLSFARAYVEQLRYFGDDNLEAGDWRALLDDGEATTDQIDELVEYLRDPASAQADRARWLGRPHLALLLAFVELLGHAREQLNGLGTRHLDYYYEGVLGLLHRPPEPDKASVVLELDSDTDRLLLPAGTEFRAGLDSAGEARIYRSERDVYLSRAAIEQLRSVFVDQRVTTLRDPPHDPNLSDPLAFMRMLSLALGEPAPGDPLPDYAGPGGEASVTDLEFVASLDERLEFAPQQLFLEHHELRTIMRLRARRDDSDHEWARINDLLEVDAADPRDFQTNFDVAVDGPLDYEGLTQVENVDDLYEQRERKDVADFIEANIPFGTESFVELMQIKRRIDGEWGEINRLLQRAGQRQRQVLSYEFEPEDPTDFDANFAAALGSAWEPAWPAQTGDLDGYVDDLRALEAHFASSAERLGRIVATAKLALDSEVDEDSWLELAALLDEAHRERDYAERRTELDERRAELEDPEDPEALDALARFVLVSDDDDESWAALATTLGDYIPSAQVDILERFRVQLVDPNAARMLDWDDAYRVLELTWRVRAELPEPLAETVEWRNLYAHEDATAVIVEDSGDPPRWRTFGQVDPTLAAEPELAPDPILGVALRSPLLALSEGSRKLILTLGFEAEGFAEARLAAALEAGALLAQVSTAKGWLELELGSPTIVAGGEGQDYWTLLGRARETDDDRPALRFELELDTTVDALEPLAADGSSGAAAGAWPSLRLMLRQLWDEDELRYHCEYSALRGLHLAAVHLAVEVEGLSQLALRSDERALDPAKPFEPFGRSPAVGSRLYFSHPELIRARLDSLTLDIEWMGLPDSLAWHYLNYPDIHSALDFQVSIALVDRELELPLASERSLFTQDDDEEERTHTARELGVADVAAALAEHSSGFDYGPSLDAGLELADASDQRRVGRHYFLELRPLDFGHRSYPILSSRLARAFSVALANGEDLSSESARADYEIAAPYTPRIKSLSARYSASVELRFDDGESLGATTGADELLHMHPFGVSLAPREQGPERLRGPRLLPAYDHAGELYIGLRTLELPQKLTALIQLAEGSADPDLEPVAVEWSVLDGDGWRSLDDGLVTHDSTGGLVTSGIVELELELVATRAAAQTILPAELCWLRVAVPRDPDSRCDAVALHTQAATVIFEDRQNAADHYDERLPVGSIERLRSPRREVATVTQPYTGYGGRPRERGETFRTRVSERLRHKQRALSPWDYERLVLDRFPQLYKAKCLRADAHTTGRDAGHVCVVVVPDISDQLPRDPFAPKASASLIAQVEAELRGLCPGHVEVEVKNPRYVSIMVRLGVRFWPDVDQGYARRQLVEDINRYLAPWAYDQGADLTIGGRIYANSIVDYVERRDYVDYLAQLRMFRSFDGENFEPVPQLEAEGYYVGTDRPDQILVPARSHEIDLIDDSGYQQDAFSGINYMKVELDFIVG